MSSDDLLLELITCSVDETMRLGQRLGEMLQDGAVVALIGELGCGKTTMTRGIASGMGFKDLNCVNSPTYVLEQVYNARLPIHHFDAYRLGSPDEFLALGFDDTIRSGCVAIIEWADRVIELLPPESLSVELSYREGGSLDERTIQLRGDRGHWGELVDSLQAAT